MAFDTYADLQKTIIAWVNKPELVQQVPDFITIGEAKLNRALRVRRMLVAGSLTVSASETPAPTDFMGAHTLTLSDGTVLDPLTPDELAFKAQSYGVNTSGEPEYYSIVGGQIQFLPTPDQSYTASILYYGQLPALSLTNPSNWLLAFAPDAYLYGALAEAAPYMGEDSRAAVWETKFDKTVASLNAARETYGARLQMRPSTVI